jgi:hypothetical protein
MHVLFVVLLTRTFSRSEAKKVKLRSRHAPCFNHTIYEFDPRTTLIHMAHLWVRYMYDGTESHIKSNFRDLGLMMQAV